jgi:hypothetical protein
MAGKQLNRQNWSFSVLNNRVPRTLSLEPPTKADLHLRLYWNEYWSCCATKSYVAIRLNETRFAILAASALLLLLIIYIYMYIFMYLYIYIYTHPFVHIYVSIYPYVYIYMIDHETWFDIVYWHLSSELSIPAGCRWATLLHSKCGQCPFCNGWFWGVKLLGWPQNPNS